MPRRRDVNSSAASATAASGAASHGAAFWSRHRAREPAWGPHPQPLHPRQAFATPHDCCCRGGKLTCSPSRLAAGRPVGLPLIDSDSGSHSTIVLPQQGPTNPNGEVLLRFETPIYETSAGAFLHGERPQCCHSAASCSWLRAQCLALLKLHL